MPGRRWREQSRDYKDMAVVTSGTRVSLQDLLDKVREIADRKDRLVRLIKKDSCVPWLAEA